jgi:hypothetical protein
MTKYSERKRLIRARLGAQGGWRGAVIFLALCVPAALIGPWIDARISPQLDAWYDAHMGNRHGKQ